MADRLTRIAIVSEDKCKPKKCRQECKKSCPVVKTGNSSISLRLALPVDGVYDLSAGDFGESKFRSIYGAICSENDFDLTLIDEWIVLARSEELQGLTWPHLSLGGSSL